MTNVICMSALARNRLQGAVKALLQLVLWRHFGPCTRLLRTHGYIFSIIAILSLSAGLCIFPLNYALCTSAQSVIIVSVWLN